MGNYKVIMKIAQAGTLQWQRHYLVMLMTQWQHMAHIMVEKEEGKGKGNYIEHLWKYNAAN